MANQLGNHRVVVHRNLAAFEDAGIDTDLSFGRLRRPVLDQAAHRGQKAAERVLGVDPALDRPAIGLDVLLPERQGFAGSDTDHQFDEVDAGDHFGHRMLDLQAGVHFEEVERLVRADDELDGARALIVHGLGERDRLLAHRLADAVVDERRGSFLENLLVPPLNRAFALEQVDGVAEGVGNHLDLDVVRSFDKFLDEHAIVAEAVAGLVPAGFEALESLLVIEGDAQTLAATTGRRLDHHRVADSLGDFDGLRRVDDLGIVAGDGVDSGFHRQLLGSDLVAHGGHRIVLRADEDDAVVFEAA
ncbi:MAG: hypothetical protein CAPSK01_002503 [Candidatus Accumulibacter vicinus]|uniref:Uncharacterized protein n=1 Tax=Candidatus Accumulibacter vicinus TaxID=2954382 RepID=A0A084XZM1_9PROT|nr:MAG: hypothetical protein CAPSK01_002503 [Candidatus Accumulibacter vicinus]